MSHDYMSQLVLRIKTERQGQQLEELKHELAWRKRSKRELEEGAARKLPLGINLDRFETAAYLRTKCAHASALGEVRANHSLSRLR